MLRLNPGADWNDMVARILRRGDTSAKGVNMRNRLNMSQVRFRTQARLLLFDPESGSKVLETYLPTTMTAKMVVKDTTKGLADLIDRRDERRDAHRIPEMERNIIAQFEEELQKLEERFANRTRELETGFDQGFESLRRLRDQ